MKKMLPDSIALFVWIALLAPAKGEPGGVSITGGKPTLIVFPANYEKLNWKKNDFEIRATIMRSTADGRVLRVNIKTDADAAWFDTAEIKGLSPSWQTPFISAMLQSIFQWKFQKTEIVSEDSETGERLGDEVGRTYIFHFILSSGGRSKIQILQGGDVVADDNPSITPDQ